MPRKETGLDRYSRQLILKHIGEEGQMKLLDSSVTVIGCGALGGVSAGNLARAGVGRITVVDRDVVELNNLQRQTLLGEDDVGRPKAMAVGERLSSINSDIEVRPVAEDVNFSNAEDIIRDCDLVIDGTDNMETRLLMNDACVKNDVPWIYGGAIEVQGMTMNILPHDTACFRCILPSLPDRGALPTCDTAGILNTVPVVIASIQSTEAFKFLLGESVNRTLQIFDAWKQEHLSTEIRRRDDCECCVNHNFEFLEAREREVITPLCGTNTIQIIPIGDKDLDLEALADRLGKVGTAEMKDGVLKFDSGQYEINIFGNGRMLIIGTEDRSLARSLYAKYVGT